MGTFGSGVFGAGVFGGASSLALTTQTTYPARVLVAATGLVDGNIVTISRTTAGSTVRTAVRGANEVDPDSDALVLVDAEQPFGVLLTYRLTIDDVDVDTETVTVTLAGGKVALSDAISGLAAETVVLSWPNKRKARPATVFPVAGRNIVVGGERGGFESTIELFCETTVERDAIDDLLQGATAGILQIRQAGPYDGVDAYFFVQADDEVRYSQDGSDERRTFALDVIETAAWAPTLESLTFTLADIAAAYPSPDDLADIAGDYATLLDIALGDFS